MTREAGRIGLMRRKREGEALNVIDDNNDDDDYDNDDEDSGDGGSTICRYILEHDLAIVQNLSGSRTGCTVHRQQIETDLVPTPTAVSGQSLLLE